jgi:hypothetical protein
MGRSFTFEEQKESMKLQSLRLSDWIWVLYPVLIVVLVLISANYILGTGDVSLIRLTARQEETEAQEKIVNELKEKVNSLKVINRTQALAQLKDLLVAMPASKKAWLLVAQLQNAATISATTLSAYKAEVGDVKEASESSSVADPVYNSPLSVRVDYEISNFEQLVTILKTLDRYLPLVKVKKVEFGATLATVTLEAAWMPWKPVTVSDTEVVAVDYKPEVKKAMDAISKMEEVVASGGVIVATESAVF